MPKVERDIALGFHDTILSNTKMQEFLKGRFGYGHVPSTEDLKSRAADVVEKCEAYLGFARECIVLFEKELAKRERQPEMDFTPPAGAAPPKTSAKEKAARSKVAKGDAAGRQKAIDAVSGKSSKKKTAKKKPPKAKKKVAKKQFGAGLGGKEKS